MGSLKKQEADAWEAREYDYDEAGQPKFGMQISEHSRWFLPPPRGWRPPPPKIPDNPADMLPDLWAFGRTLFETFVGVWGRPAELMTTRHWLVGPEVALCRDWLRNLENLVRCILIVAALTMEIVLPRPRPQPRRRVDLGASPHPRLMKRDDPSTWAVSLRVFPAEREPRRRFRKKPGPPRDHAEAAPLARRIEALYRVLKRQAPYARRLALRLARLREKNRIANCPRRLRLRAWDYPFDFYNRTKGQHAIQERMTPAHYASGRLLAAWHDLSPG